MALGTDRRASDARPPHPTFAPTPGALAEPDADGFARSLAYALDSARKARRGLTLVSLSIAPRDDQDGDAVVTEIAALVRATLRESDGVWRDGALSLSLLLADCDGPRAEPAIARLRLRLKEQRRAEIRMGRAAAQPTVDAAFLIELARSDQRPVSGR